MIKTLLENGKKIGIFNVLPLKELDKNGKINAQVEVIDYDRTKEIFFSEISKGELGFKQLKSCDAIKIIAEKKQLDFIEIKGIEEFCNRNQNLNKEESIKVIETQIDKFSLPNKIKHSLMLLEFIMCINKLELNNKQKSEFDEEIICDYILVIDSEIEEDSVKSLGIMLNYLSDFSDLKNEYIVRLREAVNNVNQAKIRKPMLKYHSEMDEYYSAYMKQ